MKEIQVSPYQPVKFDDKRREHSNLLMMDVERLDHELRKLPVNRERSVALTKLEELSMWANKSLRSWQLASGSVTGSMNSGSPQEGPATPGSRP